MDKISIIIPVYNVEQYVKKCLESVLNQTYSNLEVLIINDGSTDNSAYICQEYADKDTRIRLFHQENRGLSSALNIGLEHFTGDYLGFVDSDDWVEPDMFETLYNLIKSKKTSISIASFYYDKDNVSFPVKNKNHIPDDVISKKNMLLYPLQRDMYPGFCGYVWNKLYSADIIKASNLKFAEEIKYGMDIVFYTSLVISENGTGICSDKPVYHYLQRDTAISKSKSYQIRKDILAVYKYLEELYNNNEYSDISYWARGFYCYHAGVIADIAFESGDTEVLTHMQTEIADHLNDYIKTNEDYPDKYERMRNRLELSL